MTDERMQSLLGTWFHDRDESARDAGGDIARVMAQVRHARQQGRWLPVTLFPRRAQAPAAIDTTEYQARPIAATNGHAPTVIGRTQTMFSPVKAIVAGALVFALGGLFLVAQPIDRPASLPGAEQGAGLAPPVDVTITVSEGTGVQGEECTGDSPAVCTWTTSSQWSATDPRLSGTATRWATEYFWPDVGTIEAYALEVVNGEGAWVGTGRVAVTRELGALTMYTLSGEGTYEGLSAILTQPEDDSIKAVIVDGGLPPFPEPAG